MTTKDYVYEMQNNTGIHDYENGSGMNYIHMLRKASTVPDPAEVKPKDLLLGSFGIRDEKGNDIIINWKADGWRKDNPTETEAPEPMGKYAKTLFEDMFKGWK